MLRASQANNDKALRPKEQALTSITFLLTAPSSDATTYYCKRKKCLPVSSAKEDP